MTNRELAGEFGISPAAFSLILNAKPGVSDATRSRVIAGLEEMGYGHLLKKATAPAATESRAVAESYAPICFATYKRHGKILNEHPFFMLLMETIEERAREHGYHIVLMTVDHAGDVPRQLEDLKTMQAQGVLLFALEMEPEDIEPFRGMGLPLVALDNQFRCIPVNTVSIDNEMGTWQAMDYLVRKGHRKIGYLQSDVPVSSFLERDAGYRAAAAVLGVDFAPVIRIPYTELGSYQEFVAYLKTKPALPSAFVCDDDTIACGALRAFAEAGIQVPEDVSIIGFNDRPSSEITTPPLTTVNVPRASFGAEGVDALVKLIRKREEGTPEMRSLKTRIGTHLVYRGSVKMQDTSQQPDTKQTPAS